MGDGPTLAIYENSATAEDSPWFGLPACRLTLGTVTQAAFLTHAFFSPA